MKADMLKGKRASIALVAAAVIAVLASLAAVAVDLGGAYLEKVGDQRTADSAAYAGGLAYNASGSTTTMNSAVGNVAALNGLPAGAAVASLTASPSGDGNNAVRVTVTTSAPLRLARIFQSKTSMSVSATSYAEVKPNTAACIIALTADGSGLTLSGGTAVTASGCKVASNATVTAPCGTKITTKTLNYNSAAVPSQCASSPTIVPPSGTASVSIVKVATADPLAGNAAVTAAFAHLASVASLTGPSGPTPAIGANMAFGYTNDPTKPPRTLLAAIGCSGAFTTPVWTVSCPAGGTYHFGGITLGGGITLNFAAGGSSANTYDFSGAIDYSSGAGGSFGPGTYNIAGGVITGGGSTTSFGSGTFNVGIGTVKCNKVYYSVCNQGTALSFGAGTFTIAGGIYNGGGGTFGMGAGSSANVFNIGPGSAGYAINAVGTATTLGGMTSGTFRSVGIVASAGGTTLSLGAAPAHDLKGAFNLAGTAVLGAGTWTVAGDVTLGAAGGGGTVTATGVSVITSGVFSVAAGYSNVTLTAPTSGTMQSLVVASNTAKGAAFSEGASGNSLSGAFYFPGGPITLSGAGNVGNGTGQCLELIGSTITLAGGSALASSCIGLGGAMLGGAVALVQ
jgi:hypothetical protein